MNTLINSRNGSISMNYLKHYYNLVNGQFLGKRHRGENEYLEGHHVKLNCLGGKRIVYLTGREHFIQHFLLYKHYKKHGNTNQKIKSQHAFNMMTWISKDNYGRYYNSHSFQYARKQHSESASGKNHWNYGNTYSKEKREEMSKNYFQMTEEKRKEIQRKIGEKNRGRPQSEKTKKLRAEAIKEFHRKKKDQWKIVTKDGTTHTFKTLLAMVQGLNLSRNMVINQDFGEPIETTLTGERLTEKVQNTLGCKIYKIGE